MIRAHASLALLAALLSANSFAENSDTEEQAATAKEQTEELNEAVSSENIEEEVVAVGYMFQGEMAAREEQRNSKKIVNVISADGIGKLPDRNAAEAVQRIPGLSIERDQGEGRFVAVRGLPSQWSSTSINGNRLPTAEEETTSRATAFDFFPTEMIQAVRVSKAVTPDMEGDAIGGSVDFVTKAAPEERTFDVTAGYNYNDRAEAGGYNANILWGDRTDDGKFGYMVNATTWKRDWATDNYEPRRTDFTDANGYEVSGIKRLELRDYTGTRETQGLNGAAEYNFDNGDRIYVNGIYGTLEDEEFHYKHRYRFDKDRIELQHIHNILITEMWGGEIGGEHYLNNAESKLEWSLATYENEFRYGNVPNSEDKSYFVMRFDQTNVGFENLTMNQDASKGYVTNTIDGGTDSADSISTHLPNGFEMDPTQMALKSVELYKVSIKEKDKAIAKVDFTHMFNDDTELKFGGKYRVKERNARFADEFYVWDTDNHGPAPTLADFNLQDQPGRDDFLPEVDQDYADDFSKVADVEDLENFWNDNKDKFVLDTDESIVGANGRTFDVEEQQLATYGMATYEANDELTLIGGMRLEHTTTEVDALGANNNAADLKNDYLSVLPSIHAKYALNDDANLRAAITRTFARPDFGDISPDSTFSEHDLEYFGGNPDLDPTYSINYDLMYDMYFGDVGVVSAGLFYKDISDTIYRSATTINYNGHEGVTAVRPENAGSAWLGGLELAYGSRLDFIHNSLHHFGVNANMTKMESEMEIEVDGDRRDVAIPRQADILYNLAFFYDDSTWAARIAMNHKGEYIEEHGKDSDHDRFYGDYTSLDFSGSYKPMDNMMVYLELNNLNNSALKYYEGDEDRPAQVEYYGMRGTMGVKYSFF